MEWIIGAVIKLMASVALPVFKETVSLSRPVQLSSAPETPTV